MAVVPAATVTLRDLNRAMLARQMLLARESLSPTAALHRLLAIQGQVPRAPFVGLWARLQHFTPADLLAAIHARQVVRATMMRGTLHLTRADDFRAFRMALRDASDAMTLPGGKRVTAAELEPSLEVAREHFQQPGNFEGLRERLTAAGCAEDEVRGRAYAARLLLPLVQTPAPDRPFGFNVGGEFVLADAWLPDSLAGGGGPLELVRRYLAAWGPSTPADFAAWSGLKGAAALFEALGDELLILRDEARHTLYDLTDAPRPDAETPAPVRLLPDFDAVMLGWRDRTRVVPAEVGKRLANRNLQIPPVVLVDGFVMGTWKLERKRKAAVVTITLFGLLEAAETAALESEALALASTFEPEVVADVVFV